MFRRDIKKQFNENKYNLLTQKGELQKTYIKKFAYQKHVVGTVALMLLGFNITRRYYTFPHFHKDENQPKTLLSGELHPFENHPAADLEHGKKYTLHHVKS